MNTKSNKDQPLLVDELAIERAGLRQLCNREILSRIEEVIDKYPDFRFIQILWVLGIINNTPGVSINSSPVIEDRFYEESADTYEKLNPNY